MSFIKTSHEIKTFRIKSYVNRGRQTDAQSKAFKTLWGKFGLRLEDGLINLKQTFGRMAPCVLEIGFGDGQNLMALAKSNPDKDFLAVETHKPGIGNLLRHIEKENLANLRIYYADVLDVLDCIPPVSLAIVLIFFPDPWPKRRHHPRRLIQTPFLNHIAEKLIAKGRLELASDCADYAQHILKVLSQNANFKNTAGVNQFALKPLHRPLSTKFEQRALKKGCKIYELQFQKIRKT